MSEVSDTQIDEYQAMLEHVGVIRDDIKELRQTLGYLDSRVGRVQADNYDLITVLKSEVVSLLESAQRVRREIEEFRNKRYSSPQHADMVAYLSLEFRKVLENIAITSEKVQRDNRVIFEEQQHLQQQEQEQQQQVQLTTDVRDRAVQGLVFAQELHQDMTDLQQSVVQLHQLFIDMSEMVASQQETLDMATEHIACSAERAEQAAQTLAIAEKHVNSSRKKLAMVILIIGAVSLLVMGAVAGAITLGVFLA